MLQGAGSSPGCVYIGIQLVPGLRAISVFPMGFSNNSPVRRAALQIDFVINAEHPPAPMPHAQIRIYSAEQKAANITF